MNFMRRLFGRSSETTRRGSSNRRASHVTPSRSQRVTSPIREAAPPIQPEPEPEPDESPIVEEDSVTAAQAPPDESLEQDPLDEPETPEAEPELKAPHPEPATQEIEVPPSVPQPTAIPAPQPILTRQRQALTYGIASDVGMVRNNNEDSCFGMQWHSITVDDRPDFGFFIVADGMGGHLDGERASGVAVQTLASEMLEKIYVPMLKDFNAGNSPTILEALVSASDRANRAVIKHVPGGGTTLSAVAIIGNLAYLVHVGDSRTYLIHENKIEQLTTDHTLVQRLIKMNELTPEEAEHYPQKNVLYRAIGQNEQLKMERLIRTLPPSAHVLICSDGLWDMIEDDRIREITVESGSPQEACDSLVRLANDRGGTDNISVIVFRVPGDDDSA